MVDSSLIRDLGGTSAVAAALGVGRTAVCNWMQARTVPGVHRIPLWCLALERGVAWTPPGGERLAALLRSLPGPRPGDASPAPAPAESYPPLAEAA